jgi:hypothetical protein
MGAVWAFPKVSANGGPVGGGALTQIVEDYSCASERDIPVVSLVQVVVKAYQTAYLTVSSVPLNHFSAFGKPLTPPSLNEDSSFVAKNLRFYKNNAFN